MRKKVLRTFAAAAVMSALMTAPAFAENAVVTGSEVNLREGPGANYRVIDCLPRGAEVTVTDRSGASWYAVEYDGISGFMSSAYLRISEENHNVSVSIGNESKGYINAMYVRFRSGPGSAYSILGEYNRGKQVSVTGTSGDWTACVIDGQQGYVYSDFISYGNASSAIADDVSSSIEDEYSDDYIGNSVTNKPGSSGGITYVPDETPLPVPTPGTSSGGITYDPSVTEKPDVSIPAEDEEEEIYIPIGTLAPTPTPTATPAPVQTPKPTPTPEATMKPIPIPQVSETPAPTPTAGENDDAVINGYINGDYVRFRTGPGTSYSIIDTYNRGKQIHVFAKCMDWTACIIDGQQGYVYSAYVVKTEAVPAPSATPAPDSTETPISTPQPTPAPTAAASKPGYVNGNNVRMREGPSMSSRILGELFFGNSVTITGTSGDWTAVNYGEYSGYIYSQYVKEGSYSYNNTTSGSSGSVEGRQIADYALRFVGTNYCWGGKSPDTGFDCSGLVYYVYQQFGFELNRVAADQAMNGVHVDELEPGDILCFYSGNGYIGHVGIYIGDGKFVHSANSATGVIVTELSGYYSSRGYEARRIV